MASITTNYSLNKPVQGTLGWDVLINENIDIINSTIEGILEKKRASEVLLSGTTVATPIVRGYNLGFDFWTRGDGPFTSDGYTADMWYLDEVTGSVSLEPLNDSGTDTFYRAVRVSCTTNDNCTLANDIPYSSSYSDFFRFCRGKEITVSADMRKSHTNAVAFFTIDDGSDSSSATALTTVDTWGRLTKTHTVAADATQLKVYFTMQGASGVPATIDASNVSVALGTHTEIAYAPLNPHQDNMGCQAQYQKIDFDVGWYDKAVDVVLKRPLVFPAPMIGTPTSFVVTQGGSPVNGTMTIIFTPVNDISGYFTITGLTKTDSFVNEINNTLELEVT